MITNKHLYLLSFFTILTLNNANSQTYIEKSQSENVLIGEKLTPEVLSSFGITATVNPKNETISGNSIFLKQIGEMNLVEVNTKTQASEIKLTQNGDDNKININYLAKTAVTEIFQYGDNNLVKDYVNNPSENISLELTQDGDYLNFERQGVNELTKALKFRQTEASPSIIIRSFN
jgi:hypothetical protein